MTTAIGRLWRRAPAWRLCLAAAIACTGLAAMFPPALPSWPRVAGTSAARYHAAPAAVPVEPGLLQVVDDPAGRQGIAHFAGRAIPLPAGTWNELVLARGGGTMRSQLELLGRIENAHLTGLILLASPGPLSGEVGSVEQPGACVQVGSLAHHFTPTLPTQSPLTHECWALNLIDMHAAASDQDSNELMQRGLSLLGATNVAVAPHMLAVAYAQSDATGWLLTTIFLPGDAGGAHRIESWATRYLPLMHKGFAGTLSTADLLPALLRDPA